MTKQGALDKYVRSPEEELAFAEEAALAQVALLLASLLDETGTPNKELARRIGVTDGRISQLLNVASNVTVRSLARIGRALGHRLRVIFEPLPQSAKNVEPWPQEVFGAEWRSQDAANEDATDCYHDAA